MNIAQNDLEWFKDMPTSHKWMWGEILTTQDISGLQHFTKQHEHTGYEMSLKPGLLKEEYSAKNTPPPSNANFSTLPDPQSLPPPITLCHLAHFKSCYRINELSEKSSNDGLNTSLTWLDFPDFPIGWPSSNSAAGSLSRDAAEEAELLIHLDMGPQPVNTTISRLGDNDDDIYESDSAVDRPVRKLALKTRNFAISHLK